MGSRDRRNRYTRRGRQFADWIGPRMGGLFGRPTNTGAAAPADATLATSPLGYFSLADGSQAAAGDQTVLDLGSLAMPAHRGFSDGDTSEDATVNDFGTDLAYWGSVGGSTEYYIRITDSSALQTAINNASAFTWLAVMHVEAIRNNSTVGLGLAINEIGWYGGLTNQLRPIVDGTVYFGSNTLILAPPYTVIAVITWNGSTLSFHYNDMDTPKDTAGLTTPSFTFGTEAWIVGRNGGGSSQTRVYEVAAWDRVLSPEELNSIKTKWSDRGLTFSALY